MTLFVPSALITTVRSVKLRSRSRGGADEARSRLGAAAAGVTAFVADHLLSLRREWHRPCSESFHGSLWMRGVSLRDRVLRDSSDAHARTHLGRLACDRDRDRHHPRARTRPRDHRRIDGCCDRTMSENHRSHPCRCLDHRRDSLRIPRLRCGAPCTRTPAEGRTTSRVP